MNFGEALEHLKQGKRISREGWNGKGMFVYLNEGSLPYDREVVNAEELIDGVPQKLFHVGDTGTVTRLPNINMKSATGSTVTGWLASQTDMLAEDWGVV